MRNKNEVEKLLPLALEAVRNRLSHTDDKKSVFKEYNGYAASLGAALLTSGVKPSIAFYTDIHRNKKNKSKKEAPYRYHLLWAVADILKVGYGHQIDDTNTGLLHWVMDKNETKEIKSNLLNATIALKLALRSFVQSAASNNSNEEK